MICVILILRTNMYIKVRDILKTSTTCVYFPDGLNESLQHTLPTRYLEIKSLTYHIIFAFMSETV